ncbi:MAG: nitronate monooxygenase, partial [Gammaproteobacteria bacterium]
MNDSSFDILGIVPADLPHPGLALAMARAGGVGILDLQFVTDAALAQRNFQRLCEASDARIGLRIVPAQAALARRLIEGAGDRRLTLVIAASIQDVREAIGTRPHDFCLAEITSADEAEAACGRCDALLLRGHEAGGWVGEDTSYILLQKLRAGSGQLSAGLPLYVQGGIGLHTAAACRAAGAAGVVLDDSLLLLAESPLPEALKAELGRLNGAETRLYGELLGKPCRVYARPASAGLKAIDEATRAAEGGGATAAQWTAQLESRIGWDGDASRVLPLGQSIGLAQTYRRRYRSVGRLVQALRRAASKQIDDAAELAALDENGALAVSHGTRYPLCQGPMTRVSDSA